MQYKKIEGSRYKDEIIQLFEKTFTDSEGAEEGILTAQLTKDLLEKTPDKDMYIFTAFSENKIVGSIIFSRLFCEDETLAFLMAPVAVLTQYQGKGIGQTLIKFGMDYLKQKGITLAITYGDINFYSKTGFVQISQDLVKPPLPLKYPHGWLCQSLVGDQIEPVIGEVRCVEGLNNPVYW